MTHSCDFRKACSCFLTADTSDHRNCHLTGGYTWAGGWASCSPLVPPPSIHQGCVLPASWEAGLSRFHTDCKSRFLFPAVFILGLANGKPLARHWEEKDISSLRPVCSCGLAVVASFQAVTPSRLPSSMPPPLTGLLWKCCSFSCLSVSTGSTVFSLLLVSSFIPSPSCLFLNSVCMLVNSSFIKISSVEPPGINSVSFWDPDW